MCLAIVQPAGKDIPIGNLQAGWIANNDGAGYAFVRDGKVHIRKGFMKLKEFLPSYTADRKDCPESVFLVHFRITSMGDRSEANTHPFPIDGGALIHNGTLTGTGATYGSGPSDTKLFAERFSKHLSWNFVTAHRPKWDDACRNSKIALLYDDNSYQIINEQDGKWDDGVWYSNNSYRTYFANQHSHLMEDWD